MENISEALNERYLELQKKQSQLHERLASMLAQPDSSHDEFIESLKKSQEIGAEMRDIEKVLKTF